MKKLILQFTLLILCSFTGFAQQTVGDITHDPYYTWYHDSTLCKTFMTINHPIEIANSFVGDSVKLINAYGQIVYEAENTTGASPWTVVCGLQDFPQIGDISAWGTTQLTLPMNISSFKKIINGNDTLYVGQLLFDETIPDICAFELASGRIYIDTDQDCSFTPFVDMGIEQALIYPVTYVTNTGTQQNYGVYFSQWDGSYSSWIQKSYLIEYWIGVPPYYLMIYDTTQCSPSFYIETDAPQDSLDFVLRCHDLDLSVNLESNNNEIHAALPFNLFPDVHNIGCDSVSGILKLVLDPLVTYNPGNSSNPADYVVGDTLFWNYADLTNVGVGNGFWNSFYGGVELTPSTSVNIGDTLCFEVITHIPNNDVLPSNNQKSFCFPIVAAYDPNIKVPEPTGIGPEGFIPQNTQEIEYTIYFQNTGTAQAINVYVIDTFETNLIPSTLQIISASHEMEPEWYEDNVVNFKFPNIMLPDSATNEPGSHGFVKFKVKMKQGLAEGTEIRNRANIYFDNNPPVITPDALNTIEFDASIDESYQNEFIIYPNPSNGIFNVKSDQPIELVEVLSLSGGILTSSNKNNTDVSGLPAGVYLIRIYSNNEVVLRKLIKN